MSCKGSKDCSCGCDNPYGGYERVPLTFGDGGYISKRITEDLDKLVAEQYGGNLKLKEEALAMMKTMAYGGLTEKTSGSIDPTEDSSAGLSTSAYDAGRTKDGIEFYNKKEGTFLEEAKDVGRFVAKTGLGVVTGVVDTAANMLGADINTSDAVRGMKLGERNEGEIEGREKAAGIASTAGSFATTVAAGILTGGNPTVISRGAEQTFTELGEIDPESKGLQTVSNLGKTASDVYGAVAGGKGPEAVGGGAPIGTTKGIDEVGNAVSYAPGANPDGAGNKFGDILNEIVNSQGSQAAAGIPGLAHGGPISYRSMDYGGTISHPALLPPHEHPHPDRPKYPSIETTDLSKIQAYNDSLAATEGYRREYDKYQTALSNIKNRGTAEALARIENEDGVAMNDHSASTYANAVRGVFGFQQQGNVLPKDKAEQLRKRHNQERDNYFRGLNELRKEYPDITKQESPERFLTVATDYDFVEDGKEYDGIGIEELGEYFVPSPVQPYHLAGDPANTTTSSPPPSPVKTPSYAEAYKGVDKSKYPTLESFIEAAKNYKKYGSNTKPTEEEIKYKKYLEDKKKYDTYLKESAAEDADNTARLLRNVATDPDNPNWTPLDQYLVMNRLVKPVSEPEYVKPPSKVKSKETTEEKTDSSKPIRSSKFSEDMVRNQGTTTIDNDPNKRITRKIPELKYTNLYTPGNAKLFPDYDPSKQTFEEGAADFRKNHLKRGYAPYQNGGSISYRSMDSGGGIPPHKNPHTGSGGTTADSLNLYNAYQFQKSQMPVVYDEFLEHYGKNYPGGRDALEAIRTANVGPPGTLAKTGGKNYYGSASANAYDAVEPSEQPIVDYYNSLKFDDPIDIGMHGSPDIYHKNIDPVNTYWDGIAWSPVYKKPTGSKGTNRSYKAVYNNEVDKKKYPTLESFIEAAENYKKYGSNTKPVEETVNTPNPIKEETTSSKPPKSLPKFSEEIVKNQPVSIPEVLTVPIPNNPIYRADQTFKTGQKIVGERTTENGKQKEIYFSKDRIEELNKSNKIKMPHGGPHTKVGALQEYLAEYDDTLRPRQRGEQMVNTISNTATALSNTETALSDTQSDLTKEEQRVARVRANVIPQAKKLAAANKRVMRAEDPEAAEALEYFNNLKARFNPDGSEKTAADTRALMRNQPQALKNMLPKYGGYNLHATNPDDYTTDRELYCTPYGCEVYRRAGAKDVPLVSGNMSFEKYADDGQIGNRNFPFERVSKGEIGDITTQSDLAPANYADPESDYITRSHHTMVLAGEPGNSISTYQAEKGNRGHFKRKTQTLPTMADQEDKRRGLEAQGITVKNFSEPSFNYFRYVGGVPQYEQELEGYQQGLEGYQQELPAREYLLNHLHKQGAFNNFTGERLETKSALIPTNIPPPAPVQGSAVPLPEPSRAPLGERVGMGIKGLFNRSKAAGGPIEYKAGGSYQGGLRRWFKEDWKDVKTGKPCGRSEGEDRAYPYCRPSKKVSSKTPATTSHKDAKSRASQKTGPGRVKPIKRKRFKK